MTRVYAFAVPPSAALRAALTERWGGHGNGWGWWAPEGAEVPHDTASWLAAMGLSPVPGRRADPPRPADADEAGWEPP